MQEKFQADMFTEVEVAENKAYAAELDRLCKECAASVDSKELAAANDVTYAYIREMLNTNGAQKPWQMAFIPSLAKKNPEKFATTVLKFLADLCGHETSKKKDLSPEERLVLLGHRLKEMHLDSHNMLKDLL
jgi:hypothetical protein